ncbi:MAG: hypothetical protein KGO82_02680 [Bacteroidota bacterium]|nr:hypothetical protein [Bacteroidota bacterium]
MFSLLCSLWLSAQPGNAPIDRQSLVRRHTIVVTKADSLASLTLGNGAFAFTADITGLQSFPNEYANGVPLGTQSEWCWHSFPNTKDLRIEEAQKNYTPEDRPVSYTVQMKEPERARLATEYFRVNPHRLQMGNIGFELVKKDGNLASIQDIQNIQQELELWSGVLTSRFTLEGIPVKVVTVCDGKRDVISCKIESALLREERLRIRLRFPYPNGQFKDAGNNWLPGDTSINYTVRNAAVQIKRVLDSTEYFVTIKPGNQFAVKKEKGQILLRSASGSLTWQFSVGFSPVAMSQLPGFPEVLASSEKMWNQFWNSGAVVDFSGSTDPRAPELERRVVLSQYLTRAQCASGFPPQETGLTYNSWYGKPHLEMHWWHAVHFAQWGRPELLERSLDWYLTIARKAKAIAKRQGYAGLRWPKMTDHNGDESPSSVGAFLIWQQPHFIYMAEMLYRSAPTKAVLDKYGELLFATADFMASFPHYDSAKQRYNLGKGLIPAQECFDPMQTFNPTYELAYWSWALEIAQQWKQRIHQPRVAAWDKILQKLAPLPSANGVYLATAATPDCYTNERYLIDHPAVLGAYASLPAVHGLDTSIMKNTLDTVWAKWNWSHTWGWDFPLTAMTASRLHLPGKAIDALFMPVRTNTWLVNGHNFQDERLTIYLPGNGGLLSAVALMCTGGDREKQLNPGFNFPGWKVRWEGLHKLP